jgi:hypothetical protein
MNDRLNAFSTLPEAIHIPGRGGQGWFKRMLQVGRIYFKFYKNGLHNVILNHRKGLEYGRLKEQTRSQFQLIGRSKRDFMKLPLFGVILVIFGEFTPLVGLAIPRIFPATCLMPTQIKKIRQTVERRRQRVFASESDRLSALAVPPTDRSQVLRQFSLLDTGMLPIALLPTAYLQRRLRERVQYIARDDELLLQNGNVEEICEAELDLALMERGFDGSEKSLEQRQQLLKTWLEKRPYLKVKDILSYN